MSSLKKLKKPFDGVFKDQSQWLEAALAEKILRC
jgi:hypothetical protein